MRVKTTTLSAGPEGVTPADTVLEVSEEAGRAMIAAGAAVEVEDADRVPESETASEETEETADARPRRGAARKPRG